MKPQEQSTPILSQYKFSWNPAKLLLLLIRGVLFLLFAIFLLILQLYIVPLVVFPKPKRYISCILNLLYFRFLLLILGFFRFESINYEFFGRNTAKFTLKSGYVGLGLHKNIIDFMYYSYLINPVFTKMIINIKNSGTRQILYAPLTYFQAWKCALSYRGFQPIIVRSDEELKKLKCRKMAMARLISECFEETLGPILILLPGMKIDENIQVQAQITNDIYPNQIAYRSSVGFDIQYYPQKSFKNNYINQTNLVFQLLSTFATNKLEITAVTFGSTINDILEYKTEYNKTTFSTFITKKVYTTYNRKIRDISYQQYIQEVNKMYQKHKQDKKQNKQNQPSSKLKKQ